MRWQILILMVLVMVGSGVAEGDGFGVNTADILIKFASNGTTTNATGDYSATQEVFSVGPPPNEVWTISRLIVNVVDTGTFDSGFYGNNINLANGIEVILNKSGVETKITNGKRVLTNADWGKYAYDTSIDNFGAGNEQLHVRWTFAKSGTFIELDGANNDTIGVVLNDDFTGLQDHNFLFQGFKGSERRLGLMAFQIVFGAGILAFLFLFFAFNLKEEHFLLKLLLIFFSLMTTMVIGYALTDPSGSADKTLLNITIWFFRIFVMYFSLYLFYHWTKSAKVIQRWRRK